MKKFLPIVAAFLLAIASLFFSPPARAALIFSDTFSGGYNSSWYVYPGRAAPVASTHGITGANIPNTWTTIALPISGNHQYEIQFELYVNNANSNQTWGIGIGDDTVNWKIINTYQSSLQVREYTSSGERNTDFNWNHTVGKHRFKILVSPLSNTNFIVIEDGQQKKSWLTNSNFDISIIWISILGHGDYEFANFQLCDAEGCEEPTPTPSNTPTPTPTPVPVTKIVVVPGYFASFNTELIMTCSPGTGNEEWTLFDQAKPIYTPLLTALEQTGYTVLPFYYDWRAPPNQTAGHLASRINNAVQPGEDVYLLGHSFGGLVARAHIEQAQSNARIDAMLAVGAPFNGVLMSYPAWAGGDLSALPGKLHERFLVEAVLYFCRTRYGIARIEALHQFVPSLQQLLPTFDYLRDKQTNTVKPILSMNYQNNWLPNALFPPPFYGIRMGTFTGTGKRTEREYRVIPPNRREERAGLWKDGKPVRTDMEQSGDGTVLSNSATLPGADNTRVAELSHNALVSTTAGINTILGYFGITQPTVIPFTVQKEPQSALAIMSYTAGLTLEHPDGSTQTDQQGLLFVPNPPSGTRNLTIRPRSTDTRVTIGQILRDGRILWKDYSLVDKQEHKRKLHFNETNPREDILDSVR